MCDQDHYDGDLKQYQARGAVSRRQFGALSIGAGMMALLPRAADAQAVTETDVKITTPDGVCDAYFVHPAKGTHAAVLVWPDILGLRPAFRQMGKRLAESGYAVVAVNPFDRVEPSAEVAPGVCLSDSDGRAAVIRLAPGASATTDNAGATAR